MASSIPQAAGLAALATAQSLCVAFPPAGADRSLRAPVTEQGSWQAQAA